jgi:signal transduction histidine kinase
MQSADNSTNCAQNMHQLCFLPAINSTIDGGSGMDAMEPVGGKALPEVTGIKHKLLASGVGVGNRALLKLYDVHEEVAKRIAHRLHDESAQMLAVIYLDLAEIARDAPENTVKKIDGVIRKLDEVCEQLRKLSHELRPLILDQFGLMPGLQVLADGVRKRSGLGVAVTGSIEESLPKTLETVLYRVVQEALSNVVRHAKASFVHVNLWKDQGIVHCTVTDNGNGFKVPDSNSAVFDGLGLVGIKERVAAQGGDFRIYSRSGKGTELHVEIPL